MPDNPVATVYCTECVQPVNFPNAIFAANPYTTEVADELGRLVTNTWNTHCTEEHPPNIGRAGAQATTND